MISVGLSHKRRLPVLKIMDSTYAPWKFFELRRKIRQSGLVEPNIYRFNIFGCDLLTLKQYASFLLNEVELWNRCYLPVDVKGRTVLDVGAGVGETAAFFLSRGAKEVVCVEPDRQAFGLLLRNRHVNNLDVIALNKKFDLGQLDIPHDFLKMDIEGAESELLLFEGKLGPSAIEIHSDELGKQLEMKFDLKKVFDNGKGVTILNGGSS